MSSAAHDDLDDDAPPRSPSASSPSPSPAASARAGITVEVLFFASAREAAGADRITLELPSDATVREVRRALVGRVPGLARILERSRVAVDEEFASDDDIVLAGAVVAVLPPVSGG